MSALSTLGERQQCLLRALLYSGSGMTVEELTQELSITRNAVNQHLASLEANDFIESASLSKTGGRPSRVYTLTETGRDLFPKHYALLSNLLIHWIGEKFGTEKLKQCLADLGEHLSREFASRVHQDGNVDTRLNQVTHVLNELGYEAKVSTDSEGRPEVTAVNCVFHRLADEYNEVCELDLTLLSGLLGAQIDHKECMVKGGKCCRFSIKT